VLKATPPGTDAPRPALPARGVAAASYRVPAAGEVGPLLEGLRAGLAGRLRERTPRQVARTLLDTFDWRVFEAGGFLELEAAGKTRRVTWWSADQTEALGRCEVAGLPRFVTDLPPGPLREALAPVIEHRALLPVLRVTCRVRPFELLDPSEKTVLRAELEEIRPERTGRRTAAWIRRLRVSPVRGYPEAFREVEALALGPLGLLPDAPPVYVQALESGGRQPGDYNPRLDFDLAPDLRADAALQTVLRRLLDTVLANEDGVLRQVDTEFLHDLRVAVRRARSLLGQVKGVFPSRAVSVLRKDLGWLGSTTNLARDMDVYLLAFESYRADLPEPLRPHLDPLSAFLGEQRARAYLDLTAALDSTRHRRLLHRWRALVRRTPPKRPSAPRATRPIAQVARKRIWRAYRDVMRRGRAIGSGSPPGEMHELRIACKKLRYLMEFFRSLYPPEAIGQLIKALKAFQDNLGAFQDLQVQQQQLKGFERTMAQEGGLPRKTREAIDLLVEHLGERQGEVRREFRARFTEFAARETRETFRRLFGYRGVNGATA
jgi:CHAD domain-containing protein